MAGNRSLSTQEVAELLHVSRSTIYELIRRGEINSYKIGRKVRFTQDDVDAYIARSRHENSVQPVKRSELESSFLSTPTDSEDAMVISGQDVVLDILANQLHQRGTAARRCYVSSFEGLLLLYEGKVDAAACHLWAGAEKCFNLPYLRSLCPGVPAVLVNISYRKQGFYVAAGNPKEIRGWRDLARRDISILNRRLGSSSRILLDSQLMRLGLEGSMIRGYDRVMNSHLTLAAAIAAGEADLAIGTERVSRQIEGLEFIPLMEERYDLAMRRDLLLSSAGQSLLDVLRSQAFRKEIQNFSGNDHRDMGKILGEV